jgi:hypothetical protein
LHGILREQLVFQATDAVVGLLRMTVSKTDPNLTLTPFGESRNPAIFDRIFKKLPNQNKMAWIWLYEMPVLFRLNLQQQNFQQS